jgi:hypothetical protein
MDMTASLLERQSALEDMGKVRAWKQARETAVAIFKRYIDRNALFQISASVQQIEEVQEQLAEAPLNLFMKLQSSTRNTLEGQHFIQFKVAPSAKYTRLLAIATAHGSRSSVFQRLAENVEMCRQLDELHQQQALQQQAYALQQARESSMQSERSGASSEGMGDDSDGNGDFDHASDDVEQRMMQSWPGTGPVQEPSPMVEDYDEEDEIRVRHGRSQSASRVVQARAAHGQPHSASYAGALDSLSGSLYASTPTSSPSPSAFSPEGGNGSGANGAKKGASESGRTMPKHIARQAGPLSSVSSSSGSLSLGNHRSASSVQMGSSIRASTGSLHLGSLSVANLSSRAASSLAGSDGLHRFIPAPIPGSNMSGPGGRELHTSFVDRKITTSRGMVQWQVPPLLSLSSLLLLVPLLLLSPPLFYPLLLVPHPLAHHLLAHA